MDYYNNSDKGHKSLKILCKDWLSSVTCHGYPRILLHKSKLFRLLWVIFPTVTAVIAFYFISETVLNFLKYEVVTNIKVYDERKPLFPTISICNQNPFITYFAEDFVNQQLLNFELSNASKFTDYQFVDYRIKSILINENEELKKKIAFPLNKTIISCYFNSIPCSDDDFDWYYDFNYGNCYRFNLGKRKGLKTSNQPGSLNGLELVYYLGSEFNFSLTKEYGLRLYMHNHTELPMPSQGLDVLPGQTTNIALKKTITERLGEPYNRCIKSLSKPDDYGSMFFKGFIANNVSYSKSCCMDLCFQNEVRKDCGCYSALFPKPPNKFKYCDSKDEIECAISTFRSYYGAPSFPSYCAIECPQECDNKKISFTVSASKFPSDFFAQKLLYSFDNIFTENKNAAQLGDEVASVKVYYDELKYTLIDQIPKMDISSLISGIGGNLGLFLGLSICSFMEFIEFLWILLTYKQDNKITEMTGETHGYNIK